MRTAIVDDEDGLSDPWVGAIPHEPDILKVGDQIDLAFRPLVGAIPRKRRCRQYAMTPVPTFRSQERDNLSQTTKAARSVVHEDNLSDPKKGATSLECRAVLKDCTPCELSDPSVGHSICN